MSFTSNTSRLGMKSPSDLSQRLARQWQQASIREERLLSADAWPVALSIGKPSAKIFSEDTLAVQRHVKAWQHVQVGDVDWEPIKFRAGADAVHLPVRWRLQNPSEWVTASADPSIFEEYASLEQLVEQVDELFHPMLVRQRSLWLKKPLQEVVDTARLAATLSPGCAAGRPLRLLAGHGVDTKFFERNNGLLTRLLDERFDGAASDQGLVNFLGALEEGDHWVLLAPLSGGILPFKRMKVTTAELAKMKMPCSHILVVENERCIHLLPALPDTIAILGAGLDLQWLSSACWVEKSVGYWGDMDTWGLLMLARARKYNPNLMPLLMNQSLFDQYGAGRSVPEPVIAQTIAPDGLTDTESAFYIHLLNQQRGRFEQEYVPEVEVARALMDWAKNAS
jgi:hypothetical protein